eukprot:COSAG02_NODE_95_length_37416_cov_60.512742_8_plen_99_part_00
MSRRSRLWLSKAGQLLLHKLRTAVPACEAHHVVEVEVEEEEGGEEQEGEKAPMNIQRGESWNMNHLVLPCMAKGEKNLAYNKPRPVKQSCASTRGRML